MPTFSLSKTPTHASIAGYLRCLDPDIRVQETRKKILIELPYRVELSRLHLGSAIPTFTEADWRKLYREIHQTLRGAKLFPPRYRFNTKENWVIRFQWLRSKQLLLRLDPLEFATVRKAAKLAGTSVSEFVRRNAMQVANEVLENKAARKLRQRREQLKTTPAQAKKQPYVS